MQANDTAAAPAYAPPTLLQALGELRAFSEIGAYLALKRLLPLLTPRGDGHPVMVLPGFMAADAQTKSLRTFLSKQGYEVHAWEMGRNPGLREDLCERLEARIADIRAQSSRRVSLVGWSLGGIYSRLIAHRQSEHIRQIITLGSPFNIEQVRSVSGPVARLYEILNPGSDQDLLQGKELIRTPPPVPSTSIFSHNDGIAPWRCCVDNCDDKTENISVPSSHCGMTYNPLVLYAIAERLSQKEYAWRSFRPSLLNRLLYRPVCATGATRR